MHFLFTRIDNGVEIDFMDFLYREAQAAGFGPKTYAVVFLA
jgi:hypothetical protein